MQVVLLGAPGSGKGTQGARLAEKFGLRHIATGDLLRTEVQAGTDLGHRVANLLDAGELVPDAVILDLVRPILLDTGAGYVLDGFPRSVAQAEAVDHLLAGTASVIQHVIHLEVPTDALIGRLLARAAQEGRSDDTRDVIAKRLEVFESETRPLIDFYAAQGKLHEVDADRTPDEVAAALAASLDD